MYQYDDKGKKNVIKSIFAKFTKLQLNWGITEKELYAIIWAIEKLDLYLYGREFHIITDHKASIWMKEKVILVMQGSRDG